MTVSGTKPRPTVIETQSTTPSSPAGSGDHADRALVEPVTLRTIYKMFKAGEKFACLTCYDATTARLLERAGVPLLLVGDTAAEMILGLSGTIHAPLDFLITLTAAVKRGAPKCLVVGDMPFMSYQAEEGEALRNAGRFMTEGTADLVKLEVDRSFAPLIEKMTRAGVPVIAHVGSRPQRSKLFGGYKSVGRTAEEARSIVADAVAMEQAGALMILLEAMPNEVSQLVVEKTTIPVIGCGAGPACHGQIVVTQDIFGMTNWQPAFAKPIAGVGNAVIEAATRWVDKVRLNELGDHPYHMREGEAEQLG